MGDVAAAPPVGRTGWRCLPCIVDRKLAEMNGTVGDDLPELREAITMMGGQSVCYQHIAVARQSPLAVGQQVPPGMLNGH